MWSTWWLSLISRTGHADTSHMGDVCLGISWLQRWINQSKTRDRSKHNDPMSRLAKNLKFLETNFPGISFSMTSNQVHSQSVPFSMRRFVWLCDVRWRTYREFGQFKFPLTLPWLCRLNELQRIQIPSVSDENRHHNGRSFVTTSSAAFQKSAPFHHFSIVHLKAWMEGKTDDSLFRISRAAV